MSGDLYLIDISGTHDKMHQSSIIKDCFKREGFLIYEKLKNAQKSVHLSTIFCALVRYAFNFLGVFRLNISLVLEVKIRAA